MSVQGDGDNLAARRAVRRCRSAGSGSPPSPAPSARDRLEYIADMTKGLSALALQADCRTLANLLELARREAIRCAGADPLTHP